jgi:hypothetical protein
MPTNLKATKVIVKTPRLATKIAAKKIFSYFTMDTFTAATPIEEIGFIGDVVCLETESAAPD